MIFKNYMAVLKKYAQFTGRSRRKEYWEFFLVNIIISAVLSALFIVPKIGMIFAVVSLLYSLAVIIPGLALCVRRLHDVDKPWTWIFISFVPLIGSIWLIVLLAKKGTIGDNKFGADPK